ncbi:porin family protein [Myxococcota bacterium]|nr:porin family protein [Myxococcota bacterium]
MLGRIAGIGLSLVLLASGAVAQMDAEDIYARRGLYVGTGATFASPRFLAGVKSEFQSIIGDWPRLQYSTSDDWGVGFNARVGYRFHPHFAFEGQYEWIDSTGFRVFGSVSQVAEKENIREQHIQTRRPEWVATGNTKLFITKGRVQPFALIGMGAMKGSIEPKAPLIAQNVPDLETATNPTCSVVTSTCDVLNSPFGISQKSTVFVMRFGVGFNLYITENIVFDTTVDYVYPYGSLRNELDYVSIGFGAQYRF